MDFADETRQGDGEFYRPTRFFHIVYFLVFDSTFLLYCLACIGCLARFKSVDMLTVCLPLLLPVCLACRRCDSFVEADAINVKDNLPVFAFARLVRGAGGKRKRGDKVVFASEMSAG